MPLTVFVRVTGNPPVLSYSSSGACGTPTGPGNRIYRVLKGCDITWNCPDGDLLIQFVGNKKPFEPPNNQADVTVGAPMGQNTTPVLKWKGLGAPGRRVKYLVAVARSAGPPYGVFEDPELEDGGGGGGLLTVKQSAKKAAKKKKR